jgi:hypothetical protein
MPTTVLADRSIDVPAGEGVAFPTRDGRRPTTPTGRAILADAARTVDPGLAERVASAPNWRSDYLVFLRELTALAGTSRDAALSIARDGLASMRARMAFDRAGTEAPLHAALDGTVAQPLRTATIEGRGDAVSELRLPYRGRELTGAALCAQLDRWVERQVVEPSVAVAVGRVVEHPEWLNLAGRRVVLAGAGSEIGPLEPLTSWGADVLALDVRSAGVWEQIVATARRGAGTVTFPCGAAGEPGADLLRALPEVRLWLEEATGDEELVLGMHAYADGGAHVRLSAAFDALAADVLARRPGTALAYLGTPTDAFVVPPEVVTAARAAWARRSVTRRAAQSSLRRVSSGRLFAPQYSDGTPVADALVEQQGPNYALAKRLQRWRGVRAAAGGHTVSFNVAPAAWTRSVTKNRMLAAAYAQAHTFGIEIFAPDTCRVLMAALLVHDLHHPAPGEGVPDALFSDGAVHGGLWRCAYEPRSVLGLAALAGLPKTLSRARGR